MEFKYNPGFSRDEELIQSFAVRQVYLDLILETLRENITAANQHILVVGARGTGKTMLARRVAAEIKTQADLGAEWYPLVFGEESYQITTVGEFWLEALFHVADQTQDEDWQLVYEELTQELNEARLQQRALAKLMDFADAQGKRILLVVENLNMLFAEQLGEHDDWELRHVLQNESRLMLLGTATQRFEQIQDIQKAWFEFFTIYELEALSLEECRVLWTSLTGESVSDNRLKPIRILTGGNPRLLRLLIDFAVGLSLKDLMANLSRLIDEHTDYFKSHLDNLAATERKVFVALLEIWDPAGAREVARLARLEVSKTSALLNRLVSRGAVSVVQESSRKKHYQATERLYNIYYLMRRRSHPSSRVKAAVAFMVNFYQGADLVQAATKLTEEACLLEPSLRTDHYWAFQALVERTNTTAMREQIISSAHRDFLTAPNVPASLRSLATTNGAETYISQESWGRAVANGNHLFERGQYEEALASYDKAIEQNPNYPTGWFNRGLALCQLGQYEEAITSYDKAIEQNPDFYQAIFNRGIAYEKLGLLKDAVNSFNKAIVIQSDDYRVWNNRGVTSWRLGQDRDALKSFYEATKLQPDKPEPWNNLGNTLSLLGRYEDAIFAYDKAIKLEPDDYCAWFNKGVTLEHLSQDIAALKSFDEVIKLQPDNYEAWNRRGNILDRLGKYEDAIASFNKAIECKPNFDSFYNRGVALQNLNQYEAAIASFDKATEIQPEDYQTWAHRGRILFNLGKYEAAIASFEKVIELQPDHSTTWFNKGLALFNLGQYKLAELSFQKVFTLDPGDWQAQATYFMALQIQQKWSEALILVPNLLSILIEAPEQWSVSLLESLLDLAATGYAAEVLQAVNESPAAPDLEPLIVGLKLFLGQQPIVAQEILQVGEDVAQRIRDRQAERNRQAT